MTPLRHPVRKVICMNHFTRSLVTVSGARRPRGPVVCAAMLRTVSAVSAVSAISAVSAACLALSACNPSAPDAAPSSTDAAPAADAQPAQTASTAPANSASSPTSTASTNPSASASAGPTAPGRPSRVARLPLAPACISSSRRFPPGRYCGTASDPLSPSHRKRRLGGGDRCGGAGRTGAEWCEWDS